MYKIIISILFASTTLSLWGQEAISLNSYRQMVYEYSQDLKIAKEGILSAEAQIKAVKTGFLPSLSAVADGNYQFSTSGFSLGAGVPSIFMKPWGYSVGATIAQNVYSGGIVKTQHESSKVGLEIAKDAKKLTIDNILYAADVYYWTLAAHEAMLEVSDKNLKLVTDLYIVVKDRFEDGLIARNDLLMIETRKRESELQRSNTMKRFVEALINFNTMRGVEDGEVSVELIDKINKDVVKPTKRSLSYTLSIRPEYSIANHQIKINELALKSSLAQFRPQIIAGVTGNYGTEMLNIDGSSSPNGFAFAQVNVPIFQWNKKKHIKTIANSKINSSIYEMNTVKDKISSELSMVWSNMTLTESELEIAISSMSIAQNSLDLNTLSYNEGRLTILDVLSSQMSWLLSYNSVINNNYLFKTSISMYNKAVGEYNTSAYETISQ